MGLRPLRYRDAGAWREVRARNASWLRAWDPTSPDPALAGVPTFPQMVRRLSAQGRAGEGYPFALTYRGRLVGQVTVASITRGAAQSASIGYWVDRAVAGRGIVPTGVALAVDHCFGVGGLHRVEVNVRPENAASLRVVAKLGFRPEGARERFLHIDGDWRDHLSFALTTEDVPGSLLARWRATSG